MMPNDAKLGLVVGMSLVLVIALIFFRKEGMAHARPEAHAPVAAPPKIDPRPVPPPETATTLPPAPPPAATPAVEPSPSTAPALPPPPTGEEPAAVPTLPPVPSLTYARRPTILTTFRKAMEVSPK